MARKNAPSSPLPDPAARPALRILNRQRRHRLGLAQIRRMAEAALPLCLAESGPLPPDLPRIDEVEVSLLSATAMSRVHLDFLKIEGPTDVITFPYGEILVCPEIARENISRYGTTFDEEVALYIIHGLLHLNGYDDTTAGHARQMHARQAKILNAVRKSA